ncbi:FMN-binding protein [Dehalococcoidia bacterium]|nr:FMN-binding protein [Dehalococcoidia bacterium]
MAKKGIIVIAIIAIIALITVFAAFGLNLFEQPPPDIVEQEPPHRAYLKGFLADTGLTFIPVVRNDFAYYELHTADQQLAGFVLLGTEEGWGGPINLFVKTDAAGVIQHVHVWHHTETPIYVVGMDAFLATFAGYKADAELIWQEDVHGITGATVTAEAIIAAVYGAGRAAHQKGIFIERER